MSSDMSGPKGSPVEEFLFTTASGVNSKFRSFAGLSFQQRDFKRYIVSCHAQQAQFIGRMSRSSVGVKPGHPRPLAFRGLVADRARHSGLVARAGVRMIAPPPIGVCFADPAAMLQAGRGIAIAAASRTMNFFYSCGFVISNCTIAARGTTRLRGKGGIALSPKVVPLEPRNDVVQKLLPGWPPRVSQRQAELISKALRGSEMSTNLFIGVGKEHFDAPLCLG
jgi:hypothetical protein